MDANADGSHTVQIRPSAATSVTADQARQALRAHGYHTEMFDNSSQETQIRVRRNVPGFSPVSPLGDVDTRSLAAGPVGYSKIKKSMPEATDAEIHAVTGYTAKSGLLNEHFRSGGSLQDAPTVHSKTDENFDPINPGRADDLDQLIERSVLKDGAILYRGMQSHTRQQFGPVGSMVGHTIHSPAYTSTTMDSGTADRFTYPGEAHITIVAPAGSHGVATEAYSNRYRGQKEVTLPRDSDFYVNRDRIVNGQRMIELHYLPPQSRR